ncbi:MAG: PorV/PorQ family protein [bacterium]
MVSFALVLSLVAIDPGAGTAGFDFLRITPGAREAAMGGAAVGSAESPLAFWHSPALAAAVPDQQAQVGYLNWVGGIHVGSVAYSRPLGDRQGIGVGVVYLNSGAMKRTDPFGNELGTFGMTFADLNIGGGHRLTDLVTLGLGLKLLYGAADTFFSVGVAGNVGATFDLPIEGVNGLTAGVAARHLGYQVKAFQAGRDPMPLEFAAGLGFRPNPSLGLGLDLVKPLDNRFQVRAGIEGWVGDIIALRAGYNTMGSDLASGGGTDILAGVSTGLGLRIRNYQLDYCFVPMVELGMAHRLSLSLGL